MLWHGKKLCDLNGHELVEAVQQNNRLADVVLKPGADQNVRKNWFRNALQLADEGARRGYVIEDEDG